MNCDSWLEPKNSLTAAATGLALIISWGIRPSVFRQSQPLLNGTLNAHEADPERIFGHFTDTTAHGGYRDDRYHRQYLYRYGYP